MQFLKLLLITILQFSALCESVIEKGQNSESTNLQQKTSNNIKRIIKKQNMKDKSYFIQFHRFIMQEINKSNNNLSYSRDTKHPAINLELGWENKKDKPFFSNMLVTTQSEDFVVIKIVDDKYESIDCKLENLCMIHNATKTIKFKQNVNQSYKFSIDSSKAISTYIALDRKPELKDYFMGNKGSIRLIEMQAKAKLVNWPFFAGVIGLKPTKDNEFYKYLIDNIAFYGDGFGAVVMGALGGSDLWLEVGEALTVSSNTACLYFVFHCL